MHRLNADDANYPRLLAEITAASRLRFLANCGSVGYWCIRVFIASSNSSRVADAVAKIKSESGIPDAQVQGFTIDLPVMDTEARLAELLTDVTADGKFDRIVVTAGSTSWRSIAETYRDNLLELTQLYLVVPALIAALAPRFLKLRYASNLVFCGGRGFRKSIRDGRRRRPSLAGWRDLVRGPALDMVPLKVNVVNPGANETELRRKAAEERKRTREYLA
ncbi:hypothetical protein DL768_002425 [Monosporascus sp. mg162]|nr:hypothetical protein DL768_002425 [Monosporascus sp. mg162]